MLSFSSVLYNDLMECVNKRIIILSSTRRLACYTTEQGREVQHDWLVILLSNGSVVHRRERISKMMISWDTHFGSFLTTLVHSCST